MQIDEGFCDVYQLEQSSSVVTTIDQDEHPVTVTPPADSESDEDEVIVLIHHMLQQSHAFTTPYGNLAYHICTCMHTPLIYYIVVVHPI